MHRNDLQKERERIEALKKYDILDTEEETSYDSLTKLAASICEVPIAIISFLDAERQWFKSRVGLGFCETTRGISFCQYTIQNDSILEVEDATLDPRFVDNPLVTGEDNIRFYAGAPLINPEGHRLGSLCVLDRRPRKLSESQKNSLKVLADAIVVHLEARRKNKELTELLVRAKEYQGLFNQSADLHCLLDEDGTIEYINESVEQILGFSIGEVLGRNIWDFCAPADKERVVAGIREGVARGETKFKIETRVFTKDGDLRYFSWSDVYQDGKWLVNGRDVTSQKENQQRLQQLSLVASKINNGVVINDADSRVIWVNDAFKKITGYSLSEMEGKRLADVLRGEATDEHTIAYARQRTDEMQSFSVEVQLHRKDGSPVWLSIMNSLILDKKGRRDKSVEIITDITESKQKEGELEALSLAVQKSAVGMLVRNGEDEVLWVNEAFENLTGYKEEELRGRVLGKMLLGPETDMEVAQVAVDALRDKKPYEVELALHRKDGSPVWLFLSNNPLFDRAGRIVRQLCVVVDITERKKAEKVLIETREEAVQLSKAKEAFLSVMSHEIRTPLNAVIGISRILQAENPSESQKENLRILNFSAENLSTLINDILDFTKVETGNIVLESSDINLKALVSGTIETLAFKAIEKGIALKQEIDPAIPELVKGDQTRLYQILINLLGNAAKFTEEGEVKLTLKLMEDLPDQVAIRFEVSDTGIGIPADKLDYIFEAYTQASIDTTRKYGGTGLGLAITRKLVELHGAAIAVESEVGKGTTFYFTINFHKTDPEREVVAAAVQQALPSNVLVVDDNAINRMVAQKVLSKWEIQTDFAEDGQQALEKLNEKYYDLVLMDLHMPVMDGLEATRIIRSMDNMRLRNVPVIALTASASNLEMEELADVGMNDFVLKPFDPASLYAKIWPYLSNETL